MILFTLKEHQSGLSELIEIKINLEDDYEAQIAVLDCNDTVLIAESISENNLVLELAIRYWLSCGLYYPEYEKLDPILLEKICPKIILLKKDDPSVDLFSQTGHVVFDEKEYREEASQMVYFPTFIFGEAND